jgi:N-acetylneuraminic acid mutarotase
VRYDASSQAYIVNWHTDQCLTGACTLDPTKTYRLRVLVGPLELGDADVIVVSNGAQLKNIQSGQDIGLVDGRTLPVKFRIEQGAVAVVAPGSPTSIGASGGNIVTSDGLVALAVPAGAVAGPTDLVVVNASSFPVGAGAWSAPVDLGPTGTTFAAPVILTLSYDPTQLPPGVPASALGVYVSDGTGWELVPGSTLNAVDNTVSVPISHFSTYTLTIAPTVVNGVPNPTTISVGQTTRLSGYVFIYQVVPFTNCYYVGGPFSRHRVCVTYTNRYSYPVPNQAISWTALPTGTQVISLASNRTYTDQAGATTSPPITAQSPGSAQIVASLFVAGGSFGSSVQSSPVAITVPLPVSGTYRGTITVTRPNVPPITLPVTYVLAQAGGSVTGTWNIQEPSAGVVVATGTIGGTINGAVFAFTGTGDGPCDGTFAGSAAIANGGSGLSWTNLGSDCQGSLSATVVVNRTVSVASVTVTPVTATISPGGGVLLTATTKDATGNVLTGRAVTWASGNTAVSTVLATGFVIGNAPGSATIIATSEGKSGTAAITVQAVALGSWATKASMPTARFGLGMTAVNGVLYAVGGAGGGAATVEAYDPASDTWTTKASMPTARAFLGVVAVNGILYAIGGFGPNTGALTTVEAYDPVSDKWTTKAPMLTARDGVGVAVVNGILYAVGGGTTNGFPLSTVEAYDPASDTWTTKASMPTARGFLGVAAVNGILYAVGGFGLTTVEAYDPASDTWTTKAPMSTPRWDLGVAVANGVLYAAGGLTNDVLPPLGTLQAYDPATDTWTTKAPMPTSRLLLAAGVLNGLLYAVGGFNSGVDGGVLATVEAYRP